MLPAQSPKTPSFISLFRKPVYLAPFVILLAIALAGFLAAAYLSGQAPQNYDGETSFTNTEFGVADSAEMPVEVTIKHVYPIGVEGGYYWITEGPDRIDYNLSIRTADGQVLLNESTYFNVPYQIVGRQTASTTENHDTHNLQLAPGKYFLHLDSSHPVEYHITAKSKYRDTVTAMTALGIVGLMLMAAPILAVLRKRSQIAGQYIILPPGQSPALPGAGSDPAAPPHPYAPSQAADYGMGADVEYVCARCGNIIQNPVVQNVITCERCGEKEYVGERPYNIRTG